jgi:hypothetical protein
LPLVLGLLGLAGWVFLKLGTVGNTLPGSKVFLGGVLATVLLFGAQTFTTQHHAQDQGAIRFLQSQWLTPPHQALTFWPGSRQ